jgi:hypothetical protein
LYGHIGETCQHLQERINQHKNVVSNRHRDVPKTALVENFLDHDAQNNHTAQTLSFDFDSTTILSQQSNSNKRKLTKAS